MSIRLFTPLFMLHMIASQSAVADTSDNAILFQLYPSVVKVQVSNQQGNRGIGSGVVVSQDHVVTNCHVVANANGIAVTKNGETYQPVAMKADWHHDLCILKFEGLPIAPVQLAEDAKMSYGDTVFAIGYPNNPVKPLTAFGKIKGLYPLEDGEVIRTSAAFRMGASGGALFNSAGKLIGINTFKSPGRHSHYFSLPAVWVKRLIQAKEISITTPKETPFWDAPDHERPYFMRTVDAHMAQKWAQMAQISLDWVQQEPQNAEAWYALALAEDKQGTPEKAAQDFQKTLALNPKQASALYDYALLLQRNGDIKGLQQAKLALAGLDQEMAEELEAALKRDSGATPSP